MFIDEVSLATDQQRYSRGKVTNISECEYGLALVASDFWFDAAITFAGDMVTRTANTSTYQDYDGKGRGNLWACTTANAPFEGRRIAD